MRTVALASALGVTALGDAYNTANTAPNMLFQLAAGGLLSSAVVPLLAREVDERRRAEVASVLMGVVVTAGVVGSVLLAWAAPAVMELLTIGARSRNGYEQFLAVGTSWLRMFAPQVLLYAVSVLSVGMLQARGRLGVGALAPVATNVLTIAAAVAFMAQSGGRATPGTVTADGVRLLGWGTAAGVAAMAGIQLVAARRSLPGLRLSLRDPAVGDLRRLGTWVLLYVVVNQIGYAAVVGLASSVARGGDRPSVGLHPHAAAVRGRRSLGTFCRLPPAGSGGGRRGGPPARGGPVGSARPLTACPCSGGPGGTGPADSSRGRGTCRRGPCRCCPRGFRCIPRTLLPLPAIDPCVLRAPRRRTPALVNVVVNIVNVGFDLAVVSRVHSPGLRVAGLALGHAASYVAGCVLLSRALGRTAGIRGAALVAGAGPVLGASMVMAVMLAGPAMVLAGTVSRLSATAGTILAGVGGAAIYLLAARPLGVRVGWSGRRPGDRPEDATHEPVP